MVPITEKPFDRIFSSKLEELMLKIKGNNTTGNLNGLFAQYSIGRVSGVDWAVIVSEDWLNEHQEISQGNYMTLATIGYSLKLGIESERMVDSFYNGLVKLSARNPFLNDRMSFAFHTRDFLGIILGTELLENTKRDKLEKWLLNVVTKVKQDANLSDLQRRMYDILESLLIRKNNVFSESQSISFAESCLIYWGSKRGLITFNDLSIANRLQQQILEGLFDSAMPTEDWMVPIVYSSVKYCWLESINQLVISTDQVTRLLTNFESGLRRWPDKKDHNWPIQNEKDIQAMLWLILRSIFDEVIDEDPSPRFGHRFSIVDFRIPSLSLLVEAKYVREKNDLVGVENEIKIDSVDYLRTIQYREMIVFIFDQSASVQEHDITINALEKIPGVRKVIIASMPPNLKEFIKPHAAKPTKKKNRKKTKL